MTRELKVGKTDFNMIVARKPMGSYDDLPAFDVRKTNYPAKRAKRVNTDTQTIQSIASGDSHPALEDSRYVIFSDGKGRIIYVDTSGYDYARYAFRSPTRSRTRVARNKRNS